MKKITTLLFAGLAFASTQKVTAQTTTLRIYDTALFYGGYGPLSNIIAPLPTRVVPLKTSLYTTKMTSAELAQIGSNLTLNVTIKASCDNYDRAGHVRLALVPKGDMAYPYSDTATSTVDTNVKRLEIARFITPFMDKNKTPDTVPYSYQVNNVASILKEKSITDNYDIWLELEVFGVASAAQTQITGCSGRYDVFYGTVDLVTDGSTAHEADNIIIPLGAELNFNNYQAGATDSIGTTVKTIGFTLDSISYNTSLYLITSNHGSNANGEEYNRREHFVYLDGTDVLEYKPGFTSCEPHRVYNTQANGIYGASAMSDAQWQSFSNWCPGAYIPIRIINVGTLAAGAHAFKISVPDAQFVGQQGNFPLSVYVQGKSDNIPNGIREVNEMQASTSLYPNPAKNELYISTKGKINKAFIFNMLGQKVWEGKSQTINVGQFEKGVYYMKIRFGNDITIVKSFVKQ